MPKTFVIAQGGGPTAVINQTMVGAALEVAQALSRRRRCSARIHGVRGIRDGIFVDLHKIPEKESEAHRQHAERGARLDARQAGRRLHSAGAEGLAEGRADVFVNIGGNDTSGTQQILTDAAGGKMAFMHAPKTIDNDLMENDHTPGFISAGEFVAGAFKSRRSRFPRAARHLCRHRHGPPCRLPDRRFRCLARRRRMTARI